MVGATCNGVTEDSEATEVLDDGRGWRGCHPTRGTVVDSA
jgi:hypothetical protein